MVTAAQLLAVPLAQIFVDYDKELVDLTVSGFRIFAIAFPFMGFAIFGLGFFTALNDGLTSALISFLRTLVFQQVDILYVFKSCHLQWPMFRIYAAPVVNDPEKSALMDGLLHEAWPDESVSATTPKWVRL